VVAAYAGVFQTHPVAPHRPTRLALHVNRTGASAQAQPLSPAAAPATGSPPPTGGLTTSDEQITVGGMQRWFLLVRPRTVRAGARLPVVVVLHGHGATPALEAQRTGFLPLAADGRAILVYPAGVGQAWNAGACCAAPGAPTMTQDVAFVTAVVRDVLATEPADPAAVFLTGYSNGGKMVFAVACSDGPLFAGFAAAEAVAVTSCRSRVPESFVQVVSTGDPLVASSPSDPPHVVHGFAELSAAAQAAAFVSLDRCPAPPVRRILGTLTLTQWRRCANGTSVTLATYAGGSHAWPVGGGATPPAATVMWQAWTAQRHDGADRTYPAHARLGARRA